MKKLVYKISIAAPRQVVWDTMLQPETYKEWTGASWPGSYYKGEWKQGEKIRFICKDGSGSQAMIKELVNYQYIAAEHVAILLTGGVEDSSSDFAKSWIGITESYRFEHGPGETILTVDISTDPKWEKMFDAGWPGALQKLKEICEREENETSIKQKNMEYDKA